MSGTPTPSMSSGLSDRMNSMVLPENASRWSTRPGLGFDHPIGDLGLGLFVALHQQSLAGVDAALVEPDLGAVLDLLEVSAPVLSTGGCRWRRSPRGRGSGTGPRSTADALTTADTPASTSASAVTRSRSSSSRTTMSPGPTRRSSFAVFVSTLAIPLTPGNVSLVRESSAGIFMASMMLRSSGQSSEARRDDATCAAIDSHDHCAPARRARRRATPRRGRDRSRCRRVRRASGRVRRPVRRPTGSARRCSPPRARSSTLSTTRCVSANAATCGRWVTTMT